MKPRIKTSAAATNRMVGYVRVSTEEQAERGVSLDAQRDRLRAYATAHGFDLLAIEADEGVSGAVRAEKRPAFARAIAAVRNGAAGGIVALKLDRLARNTRDALDLMADAERKGWRLLSVYESLDTASPAGRFTFTMLAGLAQMERETISERTKTAMAEIARQGRARSRFVPFGYRLEGSPDSFTVPAGDRSPLIRHAGERSILARMLALQRKGLGALRIANALNAAGIANPRTGRPWNFGTIGAILRTAARRAALRT